MDGINPANVSGINRNPSKGVPFIRDENKEVKAAEPKDEVTLQSLLKCRPQDLSSDGKIGVIIKAENSEQLKQIKEKLAENPRNTIKVDLPLINGFAAELDPSSKGILPDLSKNVGDIKIFLDGKVSLIEPVEKFDNDMHIMMDVAGKTMGIDKVWEKGFKGKGVTICIIDTGIAPHADIKSRVIAFKDFVGGKEGVENMYDDHGHGTHCAGIAAGDGTESKGKYMGVAPEASLVGVKVLGTSGGTFSDVIAGIQWAVKQKEEGKLPIDIISMSLGSSTYESYKDNPVAQAVEAAVAKGIIVTVAAGNSGPGRETISTPANAPHVITVGAMDDKGTLTRDDDTIASFSSRGPTPYDNLPKPDVLTPGVRITAPRVGGGYTTMSGTSMACPFMAGASALIKNAAPLVTPGELKGVVMGTGKPLASGEDHNQQGAGVVNIAQAIEKLTGMVIEPPSPPPPKDSQPPK